MYICESVRPRAHNVKQPFLCIWHQMTQMNLATSQTELSLIKSAHANALAMHQND